MNLNKIFKKEEEILKNEKEILKEINREEKEIRKISRGKSAVSFNEYFLPVSILVAAVLVAGAVIFSAGSSSSAGGNPGAGDELTVVNSEVLELTGDDVVLGNLDAPVTVIEYSDFQCPYCGRFYSQTESQVREDYIKAGKVKFVYRDFPLSFHASAQRQA